MRYNGLDIFRGIAMIMVVFFHTSIYNYANINKIDFSNPPLLIVLISFLALWGGILIFYSGLINTINAAKRDIWQLKFLLYAGGVYMVAHYLLNLIFGRWANDFVNNRPDLTVVAGAIRNGVLSLPLSSLFKGSSLSTIGLNLIVLSSVLYLLLRNGGLVKQKRNYLVLGISGALIMLLSFVRVYMFNMFKPSIITSFLLANPYPLLPYLAYGLLASMIGLMVYAERKDLLKKVGLPLGLFFLAYGLVGCMNFEKTISTPDFFWYFKTQMELGLFILATLSAIFFIDFKGKQINSLKLVKYFSYVSLTVYMFETLVSEVFGKILSLTTPSWNQTINGCLIFGGVNVLIWVGILIVWSKFNFRYSLEYFWCLFFSKIDKTSTKILPLDIKQDGGNGLPPTDESVGIRPTIL